MRAPSREGGLGDLFFDVGCSPTRSRCRAGAMHGVTRGVGWLWVAAERFQDFDASRRSRFSTSAFFHRVYRGRPTASWVDYDERSVFLPLLSFRRTS